MQCSNHKNQSPGGMNTGARALGELTASYARVGFHHLGHAEVSHLGLAAGIEENVVAGEVSVEDVVGVQVGEGQRDVVRDAHGAGIVGSEENDVQDFGGAGQVVQRGSDDTVGACPENLGRVHANLLVAELAMKIDTNVSLPRHCAGTKRPGNEASTRYGSGPGDVTYEL